MNPYNKILLKMNVLEEDKPISCEYESDARYTWPERWAALRAHLAHAASQQPNAMDLTQAIEALVMLAWRGGIINGRFSRAKAENDKRLVTKKKAEVLDAIASITPVQGDARFDPVCRKCGDPLVSYELVCDDCRRTP